MDRIVVIADELTAAGFRLAGAETIVPAEASGAAVDAALGEALGRGALVLVGAAQAALADATLLARALEAGAPLVAVVEDLAGGPPPPDLARELRRTLGVEAA